MDRNVIVAVFVLNMHWLVINGAPPFSVTIDCGPTVDQPPALARQRAPDTSSLCDCIKNAFPRGVKDGRFLLRDADQLPNGDTQHPVVVAAPKGYPPALKGYPPAPKGYPPPSRDQQETEDSAERLERFQRGFQRMMHVVNVLGQVDQYLSDRTRILVSKLSKVYED